MDLGPVCHIYKSMYFITRINRESFSNSVANYGQGKYEKIPEKKSAQYV